MKYTLFGLMSGSSLDGLDCACVTFEVGNRALLSWNLDFTDATPLPPHFREGLPQLASASYLELYEGHRAFGTWLGHQCVSWIRKHGITPDYIASHGHTVLHAPEEGQTIQIGDPKPIAEMTGIPIIYDFRAADVAAGGQGAPLAPVAEVHCFPGHHFYLNLGGIANLSHHGPAGIKAWDLAPCNQVLNLLARRADLPYDDQGRLAENGTLLPAVSAAMNSLIDLPLTTPYSLDNSWIAKHYFPLLGTESRVEDLLHTAVHYIADAVSKQITSLTTGAPQSLFVTGGGAHNTYLTTCIKKALPETVRMVLPEKTIIDSKEAVLIALCGLLRVLGLPNAYASVTGASRDTINGSIWDPQTAAE